MNFLFLLLLGGVLFKLGSFVPEVQRAPFSLGWSEGSRYYNASLFLSESIYGEKLPLPVLHPTRYFLQSILFLLGFSSIFTHRLWQVALWIGLVGIGSFSLVKRLKIPNRFIELLLGLWFFMFLLTFGEIENVALVPDYEKVFLMEMVMSNNQPYLEEFHQKLTNHEFFSDRIGFIIHNHPDRKRFLLGRK